MLDLPQLQQHLVALGGGDDALRWQALQALRQHTEQDWAAAPAAVLDSLLKALTARRANGIKQSSAQKEAAIILGNMGPRAKAAVPQLMEWLDEGVPDPVREASAVALGKIGKEAKAAVDRLVQLLAGARPTLAAQAARALGGVGCADSRVRTALVQLWPAPPQLQGGDAQVAIALCKLHIAAPNLLGALTRTLVANQEVGLRKAAAEALAWCGKNETDVVPALLTAALNDTNEEVRQAAQAGLDHLRLTHEKAIRLCARQLGESAYAEGALRKSGLPAAPALIEALSAGEAATRVKAARTLGALGEAAAQGAAALTAALQDDDRAVRLEAAKALWHVSKAADVVVPALVELLKGKRAADAEDSEVRRRFLQSVMEALGRIGPPAATAVPALTAVTKDTNRHISECAAAALQQIRPAVANTTAPRR